MTTAEPTATDTESGDTTPEPLPATPLETVLDAWRTILNHPEPGSPKVEERAYGRSHLWRVTAPDGGRYLLKRLGEFRPGASLADEYRLLRFLRASGVDLELAIHFVSDDGRLAVGTREENYVLIPELGGAPVERESAEDAQRIGAAIGRLDRAIAAYPWPIPSFVENLNRADLEGSLADLPEDLISLAVDGYLDRTIAALDGLPRQLIHGDCTYENVLVQSEGGALRVTGVIDLDHLSTGSKVYDLGKFLTSRLDSLISAPDGQVSIAERIRSYVAGYHSAYPLSDREIGAMVPLIHSCGISGSAWHRKILGGWRGMDTTGHAEKYRASRLTLEWTAAHYDELDAAVRTIAS